MRLALATINIQNTPNLPRTDVVTSGRNVSGHFDVAGFQELGDTGRDRTDLLTGLGHGYQLTQAGTPDTQEQIGWATNRVTVTDVGYQLAVPGHLDYPNPPRGWTHAHITPAGPGPEFTFVDTHMTNKAWNTVPDDHKAERKMEWTHHWSLMFPWCVQQVGETGLPVVIVGDYNKATIRLTGTDRAALADSRVTFRWLIGAKGVGIDKIGVLLPRGYEARADARYTVKTKSDHLAQVVDVTLARK